MRTIPSTVDDATFAAAARIRRGATTFAARARSERGGQLSLNETAVLGQLSKHDALTPGELSRRLRSRPQSLTRTFAGLESHGLVRRVVDPGDNRQSLLTITDAGSTALAEEMAPRDAWVAGAIARELSQAERDILVVAAGLLERLAEVDSGLPHG
jgi:DNA-binding MarR family transcriptional regulator